MGSTIPYVWKHKDTNPNPKLSVWTRINPYPENPQFSTQKLLNTKMAPEFWILTFFSQSGAFRERNSDFIERNPRNPWRMILRTPPPRKRRADDSRAPESPGSDRRLVIYEDPVPESSHGPSEQMLCTYQCRQMVPILLWFFPFWFWCVCVFSAWIW